MATWSAEPRIETSGQAFTSEYVLPEAVTPDTVTTAGSAFVNITFSPSSGDKMPIRERLFLDWDDRATETSEDELP